MNLERPLLDADKDSCVTTSLFGPREIRGDECILSSK